MVSSTNTPLPVVSVIIPTILRNTLPRAIQSARSQVGVEVEIIVVCDTGSLPDSQSRLVRGAHKVLFTGGQRRGSYARNMGVGVASGDYVAFLDDDDEWLPDKSRIQIDALKALSADVISCSAVQPWHDTGSAIIPKKPIKPGERVEDYLFHRRGPSIARASIFTSSLLCRKQIAESVLWDESLSRHQDWEWLLQAQDSGAVIRQVPHVLLVIFPDSPGSISARSDWRSSLAWVRRHKFDWDKKAYVDFLAAQTLRYALQDRSFRGLMSVSKEVFGSRKLPTLAAFGTAMAGVLPKARAMRLLSIMSSGLQSSTRSGRLGRGDE